ncbi:MAG: alpha/beta fold hydrolase [Candidatus Acidiferrales bacterium]
MSSNLASPTIDSLTLLWQRVLRRSVVGLDDNFFDLGGDRSSAIELVAAIKQLSGRDVPPFILYHAPTIAALADYLAQSVPPRFSPLVPLRSGSRLPPVFMAHGIGSSVIDFLPLLKHLQTDRPIYGMQACGSDGVDAPLDSIEAMARYNLQAVTLVQPKGPYFLIGYSFGGLVALEMAQQLSAAGEKIALLAMLDAYPPPRSMPAKQRVRLFGNQLARHVSIIKKLRVRESLAYVFHDSERRLYDSVDLSTNHRRRLEAPPDLPLTLAMLRMRQAASLALLHYRPRFYQGDAKFVSPEIKSVFPDNPAAIWQGLLGSFDLQTVPGNHDGMLNVHAAALAFVLSAYLRDAGSPQ